MTLDDGAQRSGSLGMEQNRAIATQNKDGASPRENLFSDADIENAKRAMARAFELSGLVQGGNPVCPECGCGTKGKVKIRTNGSWSCYKCSSGSADNAAVWFLADRLGVQKGELRGRRFLEILGMLLDRPLPPSRTSTALEAKPLEPTKRIEAIEEFHAVVDLDVYAAIMAAGDVKSAQEYYGRWHIHPDVVVESQAVVITDIDALKRDMEATFGIERLVAAGVVRPGDLDADSPRAREPYWMVNADYPVIEPHCRPDGKVVGMQFRPSYEREARYRKHVRYKAAKERAEANGETIRDPKWDERYVPKFLSLRGGVPGEHLVGCGLPRLRELPEGTDVCVVEGFKDYLAMRTMGFEAYAIPGSKALPAEKVCRVLKRHVMVLTLDADEAGQAGIEALEKHFDDNTVAWRPSKRVLPNGWDITDLLVGRHNQHGCACQTCTAFAKTHDITEL